MNCRRYAGGLLLSGLFLLFFQGTPEIRIGSISSDVDRKIEINVPSVIILPA